MHKNRSVDTHRFAMTPRAEIPRSRFDIQKTHKTTFDAGYLVPIYVDEVLPGDTFSVRMTAFTRLSTPLYPVMDNLHMETFFFFVPHRLVWRNWVKLMGQQDNPGDSTSYVVPIVNPVVGGYVAGSIYDHMGLPTVGQVDPASGIEHSSLPLRAYNLIYNEWFRDENLQDSLWCNPDHQGPDGPSNYVLQRRGKRHDYFTSCLPWPQKGQSVSLPLGSVAPVQSSGEAFYFDDGITESRVEVASPNVLSVPEGMTTAGQFLQFGAITGLVADLSQATAATINQLRQSFQIQKLLERDARGGTRYTEIIRSHFGVVSPDARLQRPEYLGGGSSPIVINPIAQTSATGVQGGSSPLGTLGAMSTGVVHGHGFSQSFTEHGTILGLVNVRADLTYQQGLRRMWSRKTRYDFYFPAFATLGEQAVLNKEIYCTGLVADNDVFGYQERWSEYRYNPSEITGLFRSTTAGTLDAWHLAQHFTALPTLAATFIQETPPVDRVLATQGLPWSSQFIFDAFFEIKAARPLPMYSVPGLIDHF